MSEVREYEVVGDREVLGHYPGERFMGLLSEVQEQRLTRGGHIRRVEKSRFERADDRAEGITVGEVTN